jgi:hypothetical protein
LTYGRTLRGVEWGRAGMVLAATNTIIAEFVQNWATPEGETFVPYLLA